MSSTTGLKDSDRKIDPITAEVLRHMLMSIPRDIDTNISRTAYTPLVYDYKDYAVGLLDHRGRLISQGGGGAPLFVANALGIAVEDGFRVLGPDGIAPGDVIFTNHADTLGQHLNNVAMYAPVFNDAGGENQELVGFMAVLMHWIDIGGSRPGSIAFNATSIFQEGVQFRCVKLWSAGRPNPEIVRTLEANTRFPRSLMGDIDAQVAGCLRGRDLLLALVVRYGVAAFRQAVELLWSRTDAAAREVVRSLPDGVYFASSLLDNDGSQLDKPLPVQVKVTIEGDEFTVDFTGTAEQVNAPINSGRQGGAVAAARIAFKMLTTPDEPANDGAFRALKVIVPDGTIISARPGAPMGFYSGCLPTIADTVLKALVEAAPGRVGGGHHGSFSSLTYSGVHPVTGESYLSLDTGHGGWGAQGECDGPGPFKTMVHGDTFGLPLEANEAFYPVIVESAGIWADSGGAGKFRGGNGTFRVVEVLAPMEIQIWMERTLCPAWGVRGGKDGKPGVCYVERRGQPIQEIHKGYMQVQPGDRIRLFCGGGGGWGDPAARDRDLVLADVRNGYISDLAAEQVYGVKLK